MVKVPGATKPSRAVADPTWQAYIAINHTQCHKPNLWTDLQASQSIIKKSGQVKVSALKVKILEWDNRERRFSYIPPSTIPFSLGAYHATLGIVLWSNKHVLILLTCL